MPVVQPRVAVLPDIRQPELSSYFFTVPSLSSTAAQSLRRGVSDDAYGKSLSFAPTDSENLTLFASASSLCYSRPSEKGGPSVSGKRPKSASHDAHHGSLSALSEGCHELVALRSIRQQGEFTQLAPLFSRSDQPAHRWAQAYPKSYSFWARAGASLVWRKRLMGPRTGLDLTLGDQ